MKPKTWINVRLSQTQVEFLLKYGTGWTEAVENALQRLAELEENQNRLKTEKDQKQQQQLDFLKEKERIKTEAQRQRQKLRPSKVMVDWGNADGDTARGDPFRDDWGQSD